jgi:2,3-bisphosphoglycerate-independent phosphoglycerate mutase
MRVLFIFLDGVGLGADAPALNPFAGAAMPHLQALLDGRKLLAASAPYHGRRGSLIPLDAGLGVQGLPQSATGQAVLLTGRNVPGEIGYHYGPKPNRDVAQYLVNGNLFNRLANAGRSVAFLNAYPPRYFQGIQSGKRLYSSIPLAVTSAGLPLLTKDDFFAGRALSADFTGRGWQTMLGFPDAPVLSGRESGRKLAALAQQYDFSMFEYWASDYAGHKQDMGKAVELLETFDAILGGLVEAWDDRDLVLTTSDHGNLEDLSTRRHTDNPVPALLIGNFPARDKYIKRLANLTDISPMIYDLVVNR